MGKTISITFHWIQFLIFIVQLVLAIRIRKKENVIPVMRKFFWYPTVGIIVVLVIILYDINVLNYRAAFSINIFSLVFHYVFLSYFVFNATGKRKYFRLIVWLCFLFVPGLIVNDIEKNHFNSIAFSNSCLFFYSLFYFYLLYYGETRIRILESPIFLFVVGS